MINDPYGKIAKNYDRFFLPMNAGLFSIGRKIFPPQEGMYILDIGCGTGAQLEGYQKAGCNISGIDNSPAMMEVARKKLGPDADLHLGDAIDMPFPDNSYDLVTLTMALHEMRHPIRLAVLAEAKRVVRNQGRILVTDFHYGGLRGLKGITNKIVIFVSEVMAGREHFRNYRDFMKRQGIPAIINEAGLKIDKQKVVSGGTLGLYLLK